MHRRLLFALALVSFSCGESKTKVQDNFPPTAAILGGDRAALVGEAVSFDGRGSADSDGTISSYTWDFGDQGAASESLATHTYQAAGTFTAKLTVVDDKGADAEAQVTVTITAKQVNKPPEPVIKGPSSLEVGQLGEFDAGGSKDPDGTIASYQWGFGDGASATGVKLQHAWAKPGTFEVTLLVTDDAGATATARLSMTVTQKSNRPPVANPGTDQTTNTGVLVNFDGSASLDPDGTIASYEWDFGDGSAKAATVKATHTFAAVGKFTVSLTVTDDKGATNSASLTVDVKDVDYSGTYSVNANPTKMPCSFTTSTWIPTQLILTISGATAKGDEIIPPDATPKIHYTGTWDAAKKKFHMTGSYSASGATQNYVYDGTFSSPTTYTGTDQETDTSLGTTVCTINWNVTGTR